MKPGTKTTIAGVLLIISAISFVGVFIGSLAAAMVGHFAAPVGAICVALLAFGSLLAAHLLLPPRSALWQVPMQAAAIALLGFGVNLGVRAPSPSHIAIAMCLVAFAVGLGWAMKRLQRHFKL